MRIPYAKTSKEFDRFLKEINAFAGFHESKTHVMFFTHSKNELISLTDKLNDMEVEIALPVDKAAQSFDDKTYHVECLSLYLTLHKAAKRPMLHFGRMMKVKESKEGYDVKDLDLVKGVNYYIYPFKYKLKK